MTASRQPAPTCSPWHPLLGAVLLLAFGQEPGFAASQDPEEMVTAFLARAELGASTPGTVVHVTVAGRPLLRRSTGLANLRAGTPVGSETPFRLASVSKPFTALAVLQLAERGEVDLDRPARDYVPEMPWPEVTVRQLLNHTAGVPEYFSQRFPMSRPNNHDAIHSLRHKKLEFTPGTNVHYGNTGYAALALVLEAASGTDYGSVLRDRIFAPCGMEQATVPRWDWRSLPGRAVGYDRKLGIYFPSDDDGLNGIVGDGGIYASAAELDRWLDALHGNRLLGKTALQKALRPASPHPGALPYGYGWVITSVIGKDTLVWHNGHWLGFDTFAGRVVGKRANIIILSNAGLKGRGIDLARDLGFPLAESIVPR